MTMQSRVADSRCRGNPQPAFGVLGGERRRDRFFDVLDGDQADAMVVLVDHQQLLDPPLVEDALRVRLGRADRHGREIVAGHQLADRLFRIPRKPHVAVGKDARELARLLDDGNAADPVGLHQLERFGQRLLRSHGDRVDDHAAFEALDLADRDRLLFEAEVAMQHADAAELGQSDRHVGFGHRVHRGGQDRNVERDTAAKQGPRVGLARQDRGFERLQQDVVERQPQRDFERDIRGGIGRGHIGP